MNSKIKGLRNDEDINRNSTDVESNIDDNSISSDDDDYISDRNDALDDNGAADNTDDEDDRLNFNAIITGQAVRQIQSALEEDDDIRKQLLFSNAKYLLYRAGDEDDLLNIAPITIDQADIQIQSALEEDDDVRQELLLYNAAYLLYRTLLLNFGYNTLFMESSSNSSEESTGLSYDNNPN
ncbi:uncharacterized protein LOC126842721 isoform X2 [Adelges cooleyi]|uniref:uncharacterized protein LOC126842721 isoform X2 n=1 Tax=Adelges cooleyi TaxID=133065 RepID=UPI00217F503B|nr:uncharacterized protein LOC126842721 isoform X2 [Adelges cooleyi]XP_050435813.1 uncharacterized protein LOC126842721 isoform X2 [Adelges cooleyi]XP_050435821.1 uncharacterized protein LOC126842721 isoform X2 [Adelges cooleyi]XP_050435829.1 uncharacterized protein LOC126842721 isoform X2 [Adelges cooleyi]